MIIQIESKNTEFSFILQIFFMQNEPNGRKHPCQVENKGGGGRRLMLRGDGHSLRQACEMPCAAKGRPPRREKQADAA
ncbi:MAG: hypothetical protein ILA34_03150 [Bacteroidaceae bacterium]|nr:hypothetical protein [Bacteroidaceae bacterium]